MAALAEAHSDVNEAMNSSSGRPGSAAPVTRGETSGSSAVDPETE